MSGVSENTDVDYAYPLMDDFTAVVTTTILQSLPIIFRLKMLLRQWEVRLTVLEHVSGLVQQIEQAKQAMAFAWTCIEGFGTQNPRKGFLGKNSISRIRASLEGQIGDVGKRLDYMLDSLEGKSDTLPDHWIDDMDGLQLDFSVWTVEAEKFVLETELQAQPPSARYTETSVNLQSHKQPSLHLEQQLSKGLTIQRTASPSLSFQGTVEEQSSNQSFPPSETGQKASPSVSATRGIQTAEADTSKHPSRPKALDLRSQSSDAHLSSDFSSDASWPGSATSDYFSNVPSPELQDAAKAEYFGLPTPIEVITPSFIYRSSKGSEDAVSRQSSQRTERGDRQYLDGSLSPTLASSRQRSRASTVVIDGTIDEDSPTTEDPPLDYHTLLSEIESSSTPIKPRLIKNASSIAVVSKEPGEIQWQHASGDTEAVNPQPSPPKTPTSDRTRLLFRNVDGPGSSSVKLLHKKQDSPRRGKTSQNSTSDQFEERINSILTNIPASIRLISGSDPHAPETAWSTVSPQPKKIFKRSFAPQLTRAHTTVPSPPAMTLAPANERMSPMQNVEPEVKLYHLHQSGKEAPIKLFVRLVGEGERVMVRVGGGWADLGEYLKEYATHHGRRTLSDGRVDIQGLPQSHSSSPVPTLSTFSSTQVTPKSRPESPATERSGRDGPKPRRLSTLSSSARFISGSSSLKEGDSRPESRDSSAPSNHRWSGEDSPSLGLAGPKSKRINISPNKQAWVDTMLDRARHSSNEKRRSTPETFGDLGIIGGTKRLFMKSKRES
ncbi:MAG: hypothetical protein Q9214_006325 [Letrouitia sp. 1 TL-2023]